MFKPAFYRVLFAVEGNEEFDVRSVGRRLKVIPSTAKRYIRELLKKGYIREVRPGLYTLTNEGIALKNSLKNLLEKKIEENLGYVLTDPSTGNPVPVKITNIYQLYAIVKYNLIPENILLEHIRRGYLAKWIRDVLGDLDLADFLDNKRDISVNELLSILEERLKILDSIRSVLGM